MFVNYGCKKFNKIGPCSVWTEELVEAEKKLNDEESQKKNPDERKREKNLGPYSQNFIFLVTYEWALEARELHYTRLKRLSVKNTLAYW
jgi:hypothetical protein